jgi:N-acetylglutamate synthase-like GNAT family acetyltransferase
MQGPRSPEEHELKKVLQFLNENLRDNTDWNINQEYPTALNTQNLHNMSIIEDDSKIVSHAVIKPIITKTPYAIFRIGAIGSVITDPKYRNQGLSTQNLQNCLAKASGQNCDLVMLWTDQFDFYRRFGFELAGQECSYELTQAFPIENKDARFIKGNRIDPQALLKLYNTHTVNSVRSRDDIQKFLNIPNSNVYTMWSLNNDLLAYAVEGKGADLTNYIHEWGGSVSSLLDLWNFMIRAESKSYRVICPAHALNLRQKLRQYATSEHHGYLGMIRIHEFESIALKIKKAFRAEGLDRLVLEKQHGEVVLGYGTDLYTLNNEVDLVRVLFGPTTTSQLSFMKLETQQILGKILPLPLWVWGWDSI